MSFGEEVVQRRNALGLSQERLAKIAKVQIKHLSKIERGLAEPTKYEYITLDRVLRQREEAIDRARLRMEKAREKLELEQAIKFRDRALTRAIMHNDYAPFIDYCEQYSVPMPNDATVFKMGVCKAALSVMSLSPVVRRNAQFLLDQIRRRFEYAANDN